MNDFSSLPNHFEDNSLISELSLELGISHEELLKMISELEKTDEVLVVSDFDDTLYSRFLQLQVPLLRDNRGHAGNQVIIEQLGGFGTFVDNHYSEEGLTSFIANIVKTNISVLLTAGIEEFQELKINKVGMGNIPRVIVDENSMKPLALLKYILFEFKKIPKHIKIYDDRIIHLSNKGNELSELLKTEITIFEVELKGTEIGKLNEFNYLYV